jgi:hypothetical protein
VALEDLIVPFLISGALAASITFSAWKLFTRYYVPVPPNRALILYGGRPEAGERGKEISNQGVELRPPRILVGGGTYVPPWRKGVGYLSLEPIDADVFIRVAPSRSQSGVSGWEARVALQVKIPAEPQMLRAAAENLLGKNEEEIRRLVCRTVEGAVPPILINLPPEESSVDWERLASEIQASSARDLVANGLVIRSLSLRALRRFAAGEELESRAPSASAPAPEMLWNAGDPSARLGAIEARLDRTERNIGGLGAELIRIARDGTLFPESPAILPYDSMGNRPVLPPRSPPLPGLPGVEVGTRRTLLDTKQ